MYHVMSAFCPILPSDCFSTIALNNPREGEAIATKKIPNCSNDLLSWKVEFLTEKAISSSHGRTMSWGHGRTWQDMVGYGRTWQYMAGHGRQKKVYEKKVNEACYPFDKHLNWVIKGILHTSANSRVYLWKIWKLHRGTSKATYFSDFFFICNLIFSAIIRCEKQRKHSGQHCRWSINLLSRDFVDSTREVGAIATSQAVKKRSLCPADKSQFSLYPFASLQRNFMCWTKIGKIYSQCCDS